MRFHRILIIIAVAGLLAAADGLRASRRVPILKSTQRASSVAPTGSATTAPPSDDIDAARILEAANSGEAVVLDARTRVEFDLGHIPFAHHLPRAGFMAGKPELLEFYNHEQLFIVYCDGGNCEASEKVKEMLTSYNFTNVKIFRAGWPGWVAFKGPVEVTEQE